MEYFLELLHKFTFAGMIFLFFFQSIMLLIRSRNNTVRRTMGILLSLWGAVYLFTLIRLFILEEPECFSLFRENVAVVGNYYIILMLFFPIQVLMPGWLNWKRACIVLLPIVLLSVIYYLVLAVTHQKPEDILTYAQLGKSFWHFNVWFRFVLLLSNLVYMLVVMKWLYGYEKRYIQWKDENYADQDYLDISWMRMYDVLMIVIFFFYIIVLAFGGRLSIIIHSYVVIGSFSYLFYKAMFYESPYPKDFFALPEEEAQKKSDATYHYSPLSIEGNHANEEEIIHVFDDKVSEYVQMVKNWMETEQPYLYGDFKLTDVARVLPINRSYLSRIINEGYGKTFSEVVRAYRVEYAKEVIYKNPRMQLNEVFSICGFHSYPSFSRAFKIEIGMTPVQYRNLFTEEQ